MRRVAIIDPQPICLTDPHNGAIYQNALLAALVAEAWEADWTPVVYAGRSGFPLPTRGPDIDGVVLLLRETRGGQAPTFDRPTVQIGSDATRNVVAPCHESGIAAVWHHLRLLGHRRIVHFAGPTRHHASEMRETAFRELVAVDPTLGEAVVVRTTEELMTLLLAPSHPTAVIAFSDGRAAWAMRTIRDACLRVPQDVSVTGFDDDVQAVTVDPPLTTVKNDVDLTAREAFSILGRLADGGPDEPPKTIPVEIVHRSSTCPAP